MLDLYDYPLPAIFVAGLVLIVVAIEIGRWIGARHGSTASGQVATLEGALLGLLALLIGFTFAMGLSRFENRRDAILGEANAIGTTALRARLLPAPHRAETIKLLKEYVKIRLDITARTLIQAELAVAADRSNAIQEALWQQAQAVASKDNAMVPTGLFIQSLNDMIDNQAKRLAALRNRVPNVVILVLIGVAAVIFGYAGFASEVDTERVRGPVYVMSFLVFIVIFLIIDLDRPGAGFINASQQPMIDTQAAIAAFPD